MKLSLVVAMVDDDKTEAVIEAARSGGATGATIIKSVRGEGLQPGRSFLGLKFGVSRDVLLFLVMEPRARYILERIRDAGMMETQEGAGIAVQLSIEDAVGLNSQTTALLAELEGAL
ncbi:MAG: P-II family nitrogen regulator [Chloroflexi bacterium]|nr:P-II family nitrogen regulator [Chloroflexota bacterium]